MKRNRVAPASVPVGGPTGRRVSRQQITPPPTSEVERPLSPARAFVVQFREDTGAGRSFTGRAEHMVTGRTARFESPDELLAFFVRVLSAPDANS